MGMNTNLNDAWSCDGGEPTGDVAHAIEGLSLLWVAIPGFSYPAILQVKYPEAIFDSAGWGGEV